MNDDAEQLLAVGRGLYHTGKFAAAEETLQKAIACNPGQADAWFMLGMTYRSLARQEQAIDACRQAVRLDANHAAAHNLLGILLAEAGQSAEAIDEFQRALALSPNHPDTYFNLALVLLREQRVAEALEACRSTIKLDPAHADAHAMVQQYAPAAGPSLDASATQSFVGAHKSFVQTDRERLLQLKVQLDAAKEAFDRGDLDAAERACREAVRRSLGDPRALHDLGVVLLWRGRPSEAAAELGRAVALDEANAKNHYAFATALVELGNEPQAIDHFQQALRLEPEFASAHMNLGNVLTTCDRHAEAIHHLQRAVALRPDHAKSHSNLAGALVRAGRLAEAEGCYDRVLQLCPESVGNRYHRSFIWLAQGRWLKAWPDYEYRFSTPESIGRQVTDRPWRGEPLEGRRILLYADQGLGDTLQAVRYVPLVVRRGGRVLLAVQAALVPFLARLSGVEQLVDTSQAPPQYDVQAALMSLPGLFGTTPDNVPRDVPYLSAGPALVEHWRSELAPLRHDNRKSKIQNRKSLLVGIAWHGNHHFRPGLHRSIPLAAFEPITRLPSVQLISLQKGPGSEQIAQAPFADRIIDLSSTLDEDSGPFMDTATIMTQLDLVISCDTALAHLAGALAVPIWVALPAVAEWRWLLDRDDTPWYPTMRLFRQRESGNWSEVFERIAEAVRTKLPLLPGEAR